MMAMYKLFVTKSFSWFEITMFALLCVSLPAIVKLFSPAVSLIFSVIVALSILFINWIVAAAIEGIDEYYNHGIKGKK
jgi:hypothetical protein